MASTAGQVIKCRGRPSSVSRRRRRAGPLAVVVAVDVVGTGSNPPHSPLASFSTWDSSVTWRRRRRRQLAVRWYCDMDGMEAGEYERYWETQMFFDAEELDSWGFDDAFSAYYDSSSPDGAASSSGATGKKSIAQERERRRRFNEKLYTLRSLVPSITKMDKASIVKDAIDYIVKLQEEERRLTAEVTELDLGGGKIRKLGAAVEGELEYYSQLPALGKKKKKMRTHSGWSSESPAARGSTTVDVTELKVREAGVGTSIVSITCPRRKDTMARLCEALESLHLNILAANITSFSGNILHTLFVQSNEMKEDKLKHMIEASLSGRHS